MIKNVLSGLGGVGLYGIISIGLFFVVFTGALIFALLREGSFLTQMSVLPLADDPTSPFVSDTSGESRHE